MELRINGQTRSVPPEWQDETLLAVLREHFELVGAKYGCGAGFCGACTVTIDGVAVRSCVTAVADALDADIRTVEGLTPDGGALHPVQQAWLDEAVPQCGYCQAGQIMSAVALLEQVPAPDDSEIDAAMSGNLCRCGTQQRIRQAIRRAAQALS